MTVLPMFPLGSTILPGQQLPLHVFEHRYQELVRDCLASPDGPRFGVVLIARGREVGGDDVRHDVGTIAHIESHASVGEGRYELFCRTQDRIRVSKWLPDNPYPIAETELWPDENSGTETTFDHELPDLVDRLTFLYDLLGQLAVQTGNVPPQLPVISPFHGSLGTHLYTIASYVPMGDADRFGILAAAGARERLQAVFDTVENAIEMLQFRLM